MPKSQIPTNSQIPKPNKPYDLRERAFQFALRIIDIVGKLPRRAETKPVWEQLSCAGASIGANVEEADGAGTKADKRKSFIVARKEDRETRYWLRIVDRKWRAIVDPREYIEEATEIINILSSII